MATETLSVYLLKERVTRPEDALKEGIGGLDSHDVAAGETTGVLLVKPAEDTEPSWVRLLRPVTNPPLAATGRSLSALLFLQAAERWFAIAFGHGRTMLDSRSYERDFGLRAALNAVDPEKLRGLEARAFNEYALHTQRQLSRLAGFETLELDAERDILTSLSGNLASEALGKRMDGRDAARITAELEVTDLARKCVEVYRYSRQTTYRQHYPEVDRMAPVRDPSEIERLDRIAVGALGARGFDAFDVFPPEIVDGDVVCFELNPGHRRVVEPDAQLLRHPIPVAMTAEEAQNALARFRIDALDGSGVVDSWSLWDCLHYEYKDGSDVWILDRGQWYRIQRSFVEEVERDVGAVRSSGFAWPKACSDDHEGDYNERVAHLDDLALLDRATIRLPGQTPVEPCDLFSRDRRFVHVKHRKGGSGPLSHLFFQALASADCFVGDPGFRSELRKKLANAKTGFDALISAEPRDVQGYAVVLALITKAGSGTAPATELPFLSKLSLRRTIRAIQKMGLEVFVDQIETEVGPTAAKPVPARRRRNGGGRYTDASP